MHPSTPEIQQIERQLLLEAILRKYGFDFRDYSPMSLNSRIPTFMQEEKARSLSALQEKILRDRKCMSRFVSMFHAEDPSWFGHPAFFRTFRKKVIPFLRTYPSVRIWLAGAAQGEELYSLSIILQEENLHKRTRIYITDVCENRLNNAKSATFDLKQIREAASNYEQSGGIKNFEDYYRIHRGKAVFDGSLKQNVTFSLHNLVTDSSFNEFNVILCRDVLQHFSQPLEERVLRLFKESLVLLGFLALGPRERLKDTSQWKYYKTITERHHLYQRIH